MTLKLVAFAKIVSHHHEVKQSSCEDVTHAYEAISYLVHYLNTQNPRWFVRMYPGTIPGRFRIQCMLIKRADEIKGVREYARC